MYAIGLVIQCSMVLLVMGTNSHAYEFIPVDISSVSNGKLQDAYPGPTCGIALPDSLTGDRYFDGIPFRIPIAGLNYWNSYLVPGPNPRSIDVPMGINRVSRVHALMGSYWGQPGPDVYAIIECFGAAGAYHRENLVGNDDIRDYNQDYFTNFINGVTTIEVASYRSFGSGQRLDKMSIELPGDFGILTAIRLTDSGGDDVQRIFIAGITCEIAATTMATPTTWGEIKTRFDHGEDQRR
jgi:hypothetical protein